MFEQDVVQLGGEVVVGELEEAGSDQTVSRLNYSQANGFFLFSFLIENTNDINDLFGQQSKNVGIS